jgi:hypothetical protein
LLLVDGPGLSGNGASMSFSEPVRWVDDPTLCCVGEAVVVIAAEEDGGLDRNMKGRAWLCVCVGFPLSSFTLISLMNLNGAAFWNTCLQCLDIIYSANR